MGRKPNAIVSEFFNRGAKLRDSSNRYEHTCKMCGQNFPKGRSDSLLGHLTRSCPAISAQDRARVQAIWPGSYERASKRSKSNTGLAIATQGPDGQLAPGQRQAAFANAVGGLHGLNVLAEASRQVGAAVGGQQQPYPPATQAPEAAAQEPIPLAPDRASALVDPALEGSVKHDIDSHDSTRMTFNPQHGIFTGAEGSILENLPAGEPLPGAPETTSDTRQTSQLSMIAASANEMVHQDHMPPLEPDMQLLLYRDSLNNPFYQNPPATTQPMLQPAVAEQVPAENTNGDTGGEVATEDVTTTAPNVEPSNASEAPAEAVQTSEGAQHAVLYPRPIAIQPDAGTPVEPASRYGTESVLFMGKAKGRSQFSEERRREVQLVRQLGACLRCRMLKKTCSPETPCKQCKGIQNPRVWMECCIRSRLTSQLEVYYSGLQSTLAWQDLVDLERQTVLEMYPGRVEASHFDQDPPKYLAFSTFVGLLQQQQQPQTDAEGKPVELPPEVRNVYIINTDMDSVEVKLGSYLKTLASQLYESEPSHVIKSTLIAALQLCSKATDGPDELLEGVLQLWGATRIITDPSFVWKLSVNPTLPASGLQPFGSMSNESGFPINETTDPESYRLIVAQLRAAAEKCCEKLSKGVLNKIEQRLLMKQRDGQFRTFLGALILINCAERMTWLYQTYQANPNFKWPLDLKPEHYVGQGERFAGIVSAHLKMRSLAPASIISLEDLTLRATDTNDEDVINWFYSINMTYQYLQSRETAEFDAADCRSLDLKYALKLFRPPQNEGLFTG